jgi:hypothetical protein
MDNQTYDLTEHLEYSAKLIGGGSFAFGTLLFVLQLIDPKGNYESAGLYFIGYAFVINAVFFLMLVICASLFHHRHKALLKTAGLLLLNIPIAVIYLIIILNQAPL